MRAGTYVYMCVWVFLKMVILVSIEETFSNPRTHGWMVVVVVGVSKIKEVLR